MRIYSSAQQTGMALISALVMVLIIATLSIAIAQQSSGARKSTAVFQDHSLSFFHTVSGIVEAEAVIRDNAYITSKLDPTDANTVVVSAFANDDWWKTDANWNNPLAVTVKDASDTPLDGSPQYMIEDAGVDSGLMLGVNVPKRRFYRLTAKADGQGSAVSYHQTYVAIME